MTELSVTNPYRPPETTLSEGYKLCSVCNAVIPLLDEFCPKCGVRQRKPANKTTLLLLTFFLGGFGAHRFYLGNYAIGTLYALFFWTGIPGIFAFFESIVFLFTSRDTIEYQYTAHGKAVAFAFIPLALVLIVLIAVAIPAYTDYLQRGKVSEAIMLLGQLKTPAEEYMASHHDEFPPTVTSLTQKTAGKYVANIVSNPQEFYFEATMREDSEAVAGGSIRLIFNPKLRNWNCSADYPNGISQKYLPASCKE
jgi:TM2 domain-containing membrane protein YozV/Tfp pilus assembly major pilin PilA